MHLDPASSTIVAAAISATITLVALAVQGIFLNKQIANLNVKNTQTLAKYQQDIENEKLGRTKRGEHLELMLTATSIAKSAARHVVLSLGISGSQERLVATALSLTKLSAFLDEVAKAEINPRLKKEDTEFAQGLRAELMRLFLLLDLDKEGPEYINELDLAYQRFDSKFDQFKEHVHLVVQRG